MANSLVDCLAFNTGSSQDSFYQVKEEGVINLCNHYNISPEPLLTMLKEKDPGVHTMLIDVAKYREVNNG